MNYHKDKQHNRTHAISANNGGYTLLFAVLVSALVLAVGISILNISRKELALTAGARESGYAFYAADAGYECGIYYNGQGVFNVSADGSGPVSTGSETVNCGQNQPATGIPVKETVPANPLDPGTPTSFFFAFQLPASATTNSSQCVAVTVTKTAKLGSDGIATGEFKTDIYSQGYNTGWNATAGDCSLASGIKVERELHAGY